MTVRQVPKSYRNVTGRVAMAGATRSVAFESPLERDFYILLDFDYTVQEVIEQPVRIEYLLPEDIRRSYVPDALVHYQSGIKRKSMLCEVKPYEELRDRWREFRPRFKAATRLCREKGWIFHIFTEAQIRTPYLNNVKLLRELRFVPANDFIRQKLLSTIAKTPAVTVKSLLDQLEPDMTKRGEILSQLWRLISIGEVSADLSLDLGYDTELHATRLSNKRVD